MVISGLRKTYLPSQAKSFTEIRITTRARPRFLTAMFAATLRRLAAATKPLAESATKSTSPLKKVWPPDYSKLSPQAKLKFEKKYKRRVLLRSARPRWNKIIRLTQLFSVTFITVYGVLFMRWDPPASNPFLSIRRTFWEMFGSTLDEPAEQDNTPMTRERPIRSNPPPK
ncbi:hypothetical protein GGTG_10799 [Gaeumannomyces tritici R3-111a-1]|uniref:Transmembrane protein n=1 Tax=Gaeumannomyces tritici (strain R3-111a-1) TaxID=644352 RepID=J3PBC6_GAET3|nr:hypothetical protein GGTG_10799 [Gaeumannomyces tritici R3-111a-1]EJT71542.1 hypothetical protein GGTG_10799 [Gaeumannomyces tritici R3-111a-1]